jgi:hypothetical protein
MTPEDAALCERLKKVVSRPSMAGGILRVKKSEVTAWLAAIERLSAENEALRADQEIMARHFNSLVSTEIDHKGAKQRLMTLRSTHLKGADQ